MAHKGVPVIPPHRPLSRFLYAGPAAHLAQHSGVIVICAGMLNRAVPIERGSMTGRAVIQWDKEDCADLGLIKVDLPGLEMVAVLKDSMELIPRHCGKHADLAALPEDPLVYATLRKAVRYSLRL